MTGAQNDASAKPPCTRTTVGVFVDSLMSVFLSRGDSNMSNLGARMRGRVRRVTDVFRSMTYVIRPNPVPGLSGNSRPPCERAHRPRVALCATDVSQVSAGLFGHSLRE